MHPNKKYLEIALTLAKESFNDDEVPVGAIIVSPDGEIIGKGRNCIETRGCQIFHAEVIAIAQATQKLGTWRLDGHWLYSTLEPCKMCSGLAFLSRIEGIVFGATSPEFGEFSRNNILMEKPIFNVEEKTEAKDNNFEKWKGKLICNLQDSESADILKRFFRQARKKRRGVNMAMDKAFLEKTLQQLLKTREEIATIAQPTNIEDSSAPDTKIKDSADEAASATMQALQDAISNTSINELKSIDLAISKIKNGTYGQCQDCSMPIPEKRLEFFPYAIRCVPCQEKQD